MSDDYKTTLCSASLAKAKEELHEDEKNRIGAVQALRDWILQQKHLKCPTDTRFLLQFLRARKFSQLEARTLLENYLARRVKFPEWMQNLDSTSAKIGAVVDEGVIIMLPKRDPAGCQVLILRPGYIDTSNKKYNKFDVMSAIVCVLELVSLNEETQVNGVVMLIDLTKFSVKTQGYISMEERKNLLQTWQKHYPLRTKAIHIYNIGAFGEFVMMLVKYAMTEKMQKRVQTHGKIMESVYKHIPMEILPEEYLPDDYTGSTGGTTKEICNNMKAMLATKPVSEIIARNSSKDYYCDISKRPTQVETATFRKLNVD